MNDPETNTPPSPAGGQTTYQRMWQQLQATGLWQGEVYNRKKNGEVFTEWLSINTARDEQGHILSYVGIFRDTGLRDDAVRQSTTAMRASKPSVPKDPA